MNVPTLLEMVAEAAGDRVVVGSRTKGMTAGQLLEASRRSAQAFTSSGARNVVWLDYNSDALPVVFFGAALAGLAFVPVNYRLADPQLRAILGRVTPGVAVVGEDMAWRASGLEGLDVVVTDTVMSDPVPVWQGGDSTAGASPASGELQWVDPEVVAVLLFTSGTTGEPKAAVLRHRHLASYILSSVEFLSAGEDEAQLVSVPPYHIAGVSSILSSLYSGRRIIYLPGFDAGSWVRTVETEGITQAMVVPTMLGRILDEIETSGCDVSTLRHVSYGGGRMPVETIERAMILLPDVNFVNAYGLTETSSTVAVLGPEDHRVSMSSSDPAVRARLGSVGRPLPSVEVSIRDADGNEVAAGERGEVWVRGDQVAGEYLGRSVLNDQGWFPTRDSGWLDGGGFLFLDGRLDDVIVRGGENLSPGEIEAVLMDHPAVAEAAVVGVPDPEWGETVAAAVVVEPGASVSVEELQSWVRERLRSTKAPTVVQFRPEMPYNETGKLLRRVIRDELAGS
jgi:acyl-CoA synthetase (AMP-forming)/AMP-acid ligase II